MSRLTAIACHLLSAIDAPLTPADMKIEVGGIWILPDIGMDLNGMIVIAGTDRTGRSTILKAVYILMTRATERSA
mgnify:CR=1 FL=1